MDSILISSEIELYIDNMKPQDIHKIGTKTWLEWHQHLQKLNQQALIEASQLRDEQVKETLVTFQKVPVLIHEAILINIWKSKVLPELLKMNPDPRYTFVAYTILYHEAVAVSLLELIMFHPNCCESLGSFSEDLLDYASGVISQLLSVKYSDPQLKESSTEELKRQLGNLTFDIGIRSLAIVRYLAENLEQLSLSLASKMYDTYDIPVLLAQLLYERPWINNGRLYSGGKWMDWDKEALGQAEAQVWIALRQLLLDPLCKDYYTITNSRRNQFGKLLMMLTPVLLDQLSPLIELKQWLSHISMMEQNAKGSKPILIETILEVREAILKSSNGKWKQIAKAQLPLVFCSDEKAIMENAQLLTEAYNTDLLEKFEMKEKAKCEQCAKNAIQRCSRCKKIWYCSRTCQVTHWGQHKESCNQTS